MTIQSNDYTTNWIVELYNQVKKEHHRLALRGGMAIFYSPVKFNADIMLIGDNPGGENGIIESQPPLNHSYLLDDYRLAKKMRQIFSGSKLENILKTSVKLNRVFFQSKNKAELDRIIGWKNAENLCAPFLEIIINKVNPKFILAESIGSFNALMANFNGIPNFCPEVKNKNGKILLRYGKIMQDKLLIGIQHPTSARGISTEDWKRVTNELENIL